MMPFPETARVRYQKSPLAEVVFDIRFPPILKIATEPPAAFQDLIRQDYPLYSVGRHPASPFPPNLPPQIAQMMQGLIGAQNSGVRHEFTSVDGVHKVGLTQDILDLKTTAYTQWEDFRPRAQRLEAAVSAAYAPPFFTRIGLRYVDIIQRSRLNLQNEPWSKLLRSEIGGELANDELEKLIDSASGQLHMRFEEANQYLTLKTGQVLAGDEKTGQEKCFLIDMDFHTHDKTERTDAFAKLDSFNQKSGRLFKWCIRELLHSALEPRAI